MSVFESDEPRELKEIRNLDKRERLSVNRHYLKAISNAIERLNQLGVSIRQARKMNDFSKAGGFAETFESTSFEKLAYLSLKNIFAEASEELIELLASSMTRTYRLFTRRKNQHEKRGTRRLQPQKQPAMVTILEESAADTKLGQPMDLDAKAAQQDTGLTAKMLRSSLPPMQVVQVPPSSGYTSIDSKLFEANMKVKQRAATSIAINQANYARPQKDRVNCQWCFEPLPDDRFEGAKWL